MQSQHGQSQQERHHQIIRDHRAQRHRFDNHHAGRGRKATQKDEQRQPHLSLGHGQGNHKGIGINTATDRKVQQATKGNREDKEIDHQQIEREEPDRLVQMAFVYIFDHRHLKLTG